MSARSPAKWIVTLPRKYFKVKTSPLFLDLRNGSDASWRVPVFNAQVFVICTPTLLSEAEYRYVLQ